MDAAPELEPQPGLKALPSARRRPARRQPVQPPLVRELEPVAGQVWLRALDSLRAQVTGPNYETWLNETEAVSLEGDELLIRAPSEFVATWLRERLLPPIVRCVAGARGRPTEVRVTWPGEAEAGHASQPEAGDALEETLQSWRFDDIDKALKDRPRTQAFVSYIESRSDIDRPGAYLRRCLGSGRRAPPPIGRRP